jgi:transcription elongation factor Elf1
LLDIKVLIFRNRKNLIHQPFNVSCYPNNFIKYDLASELLDYDSDCTVSYRVTYNIDIGDVSHVIVNQIISGTNVCEKCNNKIKKDNKVILYCKRCGFTNPLHFQNSLSHITYYNEFLTIDFVKNNIDMLSYDIEAYHDRTKRDHNSN